MAQRIYEYRLRNETGGGKSAVAGMSSTTDKVKTTGLTEGQVLAAKSLVAYRKAGQWVNQIVSYNISTVELRTGAREEQEKKEFAYQIATGVGGVATSVLGGYAVGNIPGAIVSLIATATKEIISLEQRIKTINTKKSIESQSIQQQYIRAGTNGSRANYE